MLRPEQGRASAGCTWTNGARAGTGNGRSGYVTERRGSRLWGVHHPPRRRVHTLACQVRHGASATSHPIAATLPGEPVEAAPPILLRKTMEPWRVNFGVRRGLSVALPFLSVRRTSARRQRPMGANPTELNARASTHARRLLTGVPPLSQRRPIRRACSTSGRSCGSGSRQSVRASCAERRAFSTSRRSAWSAASRSCEGAR
jgi:hypothetical protein